MTMDIETLKINYKTQKNETWTNPQIKNHKNRHKLRLIRLQTQHKNTEHTYLKLLTPLTPSVEKTVKLLHGFK
jgi:hypothetical protein